MPDPNKFAQLFRDFADKIEKNAEKDFAGAFLVVPPASDAIAGILVGEPDIASLLGMLKTKLDVAVNKIDEEQKKMQAFGRR